MAPSITWCWTLLLGLLASIAPEVAGLGKPRAVTIQSVYPNYGSCYGGTYLTIEGSGFSFPNDINPWDEQAVFVGTVPCKIVPHYSNSTRITCITGASLPWTWQPQLPVSVQLFSGLGGAQNTRIDNAFTYDRYDTSAIAWADNWAGTGGTQLKFHTIVWRQITSAHYLDIMIGDEVLCDMDEETLPLTTSNGRLNDANRLVRCTLPDSDFVVPGRFNVTLLHHSIDRVDGECPNAACYPENPDQAGEAGGTGYRYHGWGKGQVVQYTSETLGRQRWWWFGTVDLATGEASHFTVYPAAESVEPVRGGVYGGNILTIKGTSFSPVAEENEVMLGDVPCTVFHATSNELKCKLKALGEHKLKNYPNSRGLRAYAYSWSWGFDSFSMKLFTDASVIDKYLAQSRIDWTSSSRIGDRASMDRFVREYVGYFIPPVTANYSFYVAGDDFVELWMGEGNDPDSEQLVCQCLGAVPIRTYREFNPEMFFARANIPAGGPYFGPSQQISDYQELFAGERYSFRLLFRDASGNDFLRLGMKVTGMRDAVNAKGERFSPSTLENIMGGHPAGELQTIRFSTSNLQREQIKLIMHHPPNPETFTWRLRFTGPTGLSYFQALSSDMSEWDVRNTLRNARDYSVQGSPYVLGNCRYGVSVSKEDFVQLNERHFTINFQCSSEPGVDSWMPTFEATSELGFARMERIQYPGPATTGSYRIGWRGQWSDPIPMRSSSDDQADSIVKFFRSEDMDDRVEVEAWPCTDCYWNMEWWRMYIRFREPRGDVPELEIDSSDVSGDGNPSFAVYTLEDGDEDAVFLERIPADYFEQPDMDKFAQENLALGKPAVASGSAHGSGPLQLTDGKAGSGIWNWQYCWHSTGGASWATIDLGEERVVDMVRVQYRTDCCTNQGDDITVYVGNGGNQADAVCKDSVDFPSMYRGQVRCDSPLRGRYVTLAKSATMVICEVEVFGESPSHCTDNSQGLYGYQFQADYFLGDDLLLSGGPVGERGCMDLCNVNARCTAFSVNTATGDCSLYDAAGATNGNSSSTDNSWTNCNTELECADSKLGGTTMDCWDLNTGLDGYNYMPCDGVIAGCGCCRRGGQTNTVQLRVTSRGVVGGTKSTSYPTFTFAQWMSPILTNISQTVIDLGVDRQVLLTVMNIENITGLQVRLNETDMVLCANLTLVEADVQGTLPTQTHVLGGLSSIRIPEARMSVFECFVEDVPAGIYELSLFSPTQGFGKSTVPSIKIVPSIASMEPTEGSFEGGTVVSFKGLGLRGLPCSSVFLAWDPNHAQRQPFTELATLGIILEDLGVTDADLACLTPSWRLQSSPTGGEERPLQLSIIPGEDDEGNYFDNILFTYKEALTPRVSAISPAEYSAAVSGFLTFTGTNLKQAAGNSAHAPKIKIGDRFCEVDEDRYTDESVKCWLTRAVGQPPVLPAYEPMLWFPAWGRALLPYNQIYLESRFEITKVHPVIGSVAGGVMYTIQGAGFHPFDINKNIVQLTYTDGSVQPCKILSGTGTELTCQLQGASPYSSQVVGGGRRLAEQPESHADAEARTLELCSGHGSDHAKGHCFARKLLKSGSLKRHEHANVHHFERNIHHLANRHPTQLESFEELCTYDENGTPICGAAGDEVLPPEMDDEIAQIMMAAELEISPRGPGPVVIGKDEPAPVTVEARRLEEVQSEDLDSAMLVDESSALLESSAPLIDEDPFSTESTTSTTPPPPIVLDIEGTLSVTIGTLQATCKTGVKEGTCWARGCHCPGTQDGDETCAVPETPDNELDCVRDPSGGKWCPAAPSDCTVKLSEDITFTVTDVSPLNGSFVDADDVFVKMTPFVDPALVKVVFGETNCPVDVNRSYDDTEDNTTVIVVPLCAFQASTVPVYVLVGDTGYALQATPFISAPYLFTQNLQLFSISRDTGAYCGGTKVVITGAGFSPIPSENRVHVGIFGFDVLESSLTQLTALTPSAPSLEEQKVQVRVSPATFQRPKGFYAEYMTGWVGPDVVAPGSSQAATFARVEESISYLAREEFPFDYRFQARYSALFHVTTAGTYKFALTSDDGSKLLLNGVVLIDHMGNHPMIMRTATIDLNVGSYSMIVQYFQDAGGAGLELQYSGPDTGYVLTTEFGVSVEPLPAPEAVFNEELPYLAYTYSPDSAASGPQVKGISRSGDILSVSVEQGSFAFPAVSGISVVLGTASRPVDNFQCDSVVLEGAGQYACTLPENLPAGEWSVRLWMEFGYTCPWVTTMQQQARVLEVAVDSEVMTVNDTDRWKLIIQGQSSTFGYSSSYWEDDTLIPAGGTDAKLQAYLTTRFRRIRMCNQGSPDQSCTSHSFSREWNNALELFTAGEIRDTTVNQAGILRIFSPETWFDYPDMRRTETATASRPCPMQSPGFNVHCGGGSARWGWCVNCANQECQPTGGDADGAVGLGLHDEFGFSTTAGWTLAFASGVDSDTCAGKLYGGDDNAVNGKIEVYVEDTSFDPSTDNLPTFEVGYGGGSELMLRGSNFGLTPEENDIRVCGTKCEVLSVVAGEYGNSSDVTCRIPPYVTQELVEEYPLVFPVDEIARSEYVTRFFTDITDLEGRESDVAEAAFLSAADDPVYLEYMRSNCFFAFELSDFKVAKVESVAFFPPTNPHRRNMARESVFEVRVPNGTWVQVASAKQADVTGHSIAQGWNSFNLETPIIGQAFRIRPLDNVCSNSGWGTSRGAEILRGVRFFGTVFSHNPATECMVEMFSVNNKLSSGRGDGFLVSALISYKLDRTPLLENLSPNRGTARGGTLITLSGTGFTPVAADGQALTSNVSDDVVINFNGYNCIAQTVSDSEVTCITTERFQINTPSTSMWVRGKGYALLSGNTTERTIFRYIDRWSNQFTWLDSERPIDGDSVIVPEGQAVLLDQDTPILFFVMINGWMEFDRKDLKFSAHYLWVAGGTLNVGSEEEPFLNKAVFEMYGDRWYTIELPFIGCKMVAVTNRGGLHGGCHEKTTNSRGRSEAPACPVQSVGKLDLHGRPDTAWTRLVETAEVGDTILKLAEPVNWLVGAQVVITQSERWHAEEERLVVAVTDGGYTLELDRPLNHQHLGIWYHHEEILAPVDLRAAVGLMSKNIIIKSDDSGLRPGNSYLFGTHVGAFFGGEMRIENTEFTMTGQAANFGRYSSHWHVLAVGRNVDVVDKAYLRNNSYHDTFQRAVVVHSTDFAVVRDNVAVRTHGHSFFTEVGDEDFVLFEHNLAVHPLPHHLLLDDDEQPAGFWLPGFTGWHRSNMAAGCVRGWRVRLLGDVAAAATDLTFYNNSVHASGHGWHLKPPHRPRTLNNFRTFTAFRCGEGMFYYGTGNIFHDDHRFVECNQGFHMNHLSNNVNTAPFFHDLIVVGNIDDSAPSSRTGRALSGPKDNEYFFTSGATLINMYYRSAFAHCWETSCTVRYERLKWFNSYRYTSNSYGMSAIFHDLDGTLTNYTNGFVTWYTPYLEFPECEVRPEHVGGIVCGKEDGSLRMRRNYAHGQEPWQLDGKDFIVQTSAGTGTVPFDFKKLYGWAIPTVTEHEYDMRIDDPNDFQKLTFKWSEPPYVLSDWGYTPDSFHHRYLDRPYTKYTPVDENALIHLNYTDWRDRFEGALFYGTVLDRIPTFADPFGSFSMKLWEDQCNLYNLTENSSLICTGEYLTHTTGELKLELEMTPQLPQVNGRLTWVVASKVQESDGSYGRTPETTAQLTQSFQAFECPVTGCLTPPPNPNQDDDNCRLWSDASGWPGGVLPAEWDNTEIPADDCVILDIETPKLHWLTIIGKLKFSRVNNTVLNIHSAKVWGVMEVGTPDEPIPRDVTATVAMWGDETRHTVIMVEGLFLVNKVISVLGTLTAAGESLTVANSRPWTRLSKTAEVGDTVIEIHGDVEGLQWATGMKVGIGATEYPDPPTMETEVREITSLSCNALLDTCELGLDSPLMYRHFAGVVSDRNDDGHWREIVLEAPVALLGGRANVIFKTGEESGWDAAHGGYINIGGSSDGVWVGKANISDVEFIRLGKHFYQQPAFKFNFLENSGMNLPDDRRSVIANSVFSFSQAGGVELNGASDVEIVNNVFHRTYRTAVWVTSTCEEYSISIDGNMALETLRHPEETNQWIRPFASFLIEVRPRVLYGNVAAGSADSGFVVRPQMQQVCSDQLPSLEPEQVNEAVACLTGVFMLRASDSEKDCARLHGFRVWKSAHIGITTVDQSASVRLDTMVVSDNHIGISLNFVNGFGGVTAHRVYMHNLTVFGTTPASVCGKSMECRALGADPGISMEGRTCASVLPRSYRRAGIITHVLNSIPKLCEASGKLKVCRPPTTPVKTCVMPWEKRIGSQGARYSETHISAITFGFFRWNDCNRRSAAFTYHPSSIDFNFPYFFSEVKWLNMDDRSDSRFDLTSMSGDDAFTQIAIVDKDGTLLESGVPEGSVVPFTNPALALQSCVGKSGYYSCPQLKLRLMTWEPVGSPPERVLGNMKLWRAGTKRSTWSRGPYKAVCIPTDPPAIRSFAIQPDQYYNLTLFASSPAHHRFAYYNDDPEPIGIALHLSQPFRMEVYQDGQLLDENMYDTSQCCGTPRYPTKDDPHGSYAFDPHQRRVYFTMRGGTHNGVPSTKGGGQLLLRAMQVVQLSLTMKVGIREFDGDSVVTNIATLLQIDSSRLRIVAVQSNAQVQQQGGRRLQKSRSFNPRDFMGGRRLEENTTEAEDDANSTSFTVQIMEKDPTPLSEEILTSGMDPDVASQLNLTVKTTTTTLAPDDLDNMTDDDMNDTNVTDMIVTEFDAVKSEELTSLASTINTLASTGEIADTLGVETVVEEVESTDIQSVDATKTTTSTSSSTSTSTSSSSSTATSQTTTTSSTTSTTISTTSTSVSTTSSSSSSSSSSSTSTMSSTSTSLSTESTGSTLSSESTTTSTSVSRGSTTTSTTSSGSSTTLSSTSETSASSASPSSSTSTSNTPTTTSSTSVSSGSTPASLTSTSSSVSSESSTTSTSASSTSTSLSSTSTDSSQSSTSTSESSATSTSTTESSGSSASSESSTSSTSTSGSTTSSSPSSASSESTSSSSSSSGSSASSSSTLSSSSASTSSSRSSMSSESSSTSLSSASSTSSSETLAPGQTTASSKSSSSTSLTTGTETSTSTTTSATTGTTGSSKSSSSTSGSSTSSETTGSSTSTTESSSSSSPSSASSSASSGSSTSSSASSASSSSTSPSSASTGSSTSSGSTPYSMTSTTSTATTRFTATSSTSSASGSSTVSASSSPSSESSHSSSSSSAQSSSTTSRSSSESTGTSKSTSSASSASTGSTGSSSATTSSSLSSGSTARSYTSTTSSGSSKSSGSTASSDTTSSSSESSASSTTPSSMSSESSTTSSASSSSSSQSSATSSSSSTGSSSSSSSSASSGSSSSSASSTSTSGSSSTSSSDSSMSSTSSSPTTASSPASLTSTSSSASTASSTTDSSTTSTSASDSTTTSTSGTDSMTTSMNASDSNMTTTIANGSSTSTSTAVENMTSTSDSSTSTGTGSTSSSSTSASTMTTARGTSSTSSASTGSSSSSSASSTSSPSSPSSSSSSSPPVVSTGDVHQVDGNIFLTVSDSSSVIGNADAIDGIEQGIANGLDGVEKSMVTVTGITEDTARRLADDGRALTATVRLIVTYRIDAPETIGITQDDVTSADNQIMTQINEQFVAKGVTTTVQAIEVPAPTITIIVGGTPAPSPTPPPQAASSSSNDDSNTATIVGVVVAVCLVMVCMCVGVFFMVKSSHKWKKDEGVSLVDAFVAPGHNDGGLSDDDRSGAGDRNADRSPTNHLRQVAASDEDAAGKYGPSDAYPPPPAAAAPKAAARGRFGASLAADRPPKVPGGISPGSDRSSDC